MVNRLRLSDASMCARLCLFVELKSGREREVFDGLDATCKETWAIHVFYPSMAGRRTVRSVVLWAKARLAC